MAENRVIGSGMYLPWLLPADVNHFKALTTGHTVIMGRRTYDTLERPLPDRRNVVVTRNRDYCRPGVAVVHSLSDALSLSQEEDEVFVAGGGEIYEEALPLADRLYLTVIHARVDGDVFFPEFEASAWTLIEDERHDQDERHAHSFSFRLYERRE